MAYADIEVDIEDMPGLAERNVDPGIKAKLKGRYSGNPTQ